MKGFLKKRWHSIPIGIITAVLLICVLTGSAFAAYNFLGFTTEIAVDEPLKVEMRWLDYNEDKWTDWWELTGDTSADELTLSMSPGEVQTFGIRVYNISYSPLTVNTVIAGQIGHFTFVGFPNGQIPGSNGNNLLHEWQGVATITADGDTPPRTYDVTFTFTRQ